MGSVFVLGVACGFAFLGLLQFVGRRLPGWHRAAFRYWWTLKWRRKGGRPRINAELIALIERMRLENPLWGAPRIHGELTKLGFRVAQSTVSKYMPRPPARGDDWAAFLQHNAGHIVAIDMLTVRTLTFERLYGFVVLGHGRRRILHVEAAARPNAVWLAHEIAKVFAQAPAPAFLVRDNDRAYGRVFRCRLRGLGIRDQPTAPHSPWQNGHVERLIGSIRRECLNHIVIWNVAHLRSVLWAYADYYNNDRTHLALGKDTPLGRRVETRGTIRSRITGAGLHRRYFRHARN